MIGELLGAVAAGLMFRFVFLNFDPDAEEDGDGDVSARIGCLARGILGQALRLHRLEVRHVEPSADRGQHCGDLQNESSCIMATERQQEQVMCTYTHTHTMPP